MKENETEKKRGEEGKHVQKLLVATEWYIET